MMLLRLILSLVLSQKATCFVTRTPRHGRSVPSWTGPAHVDPALETSLQSHVARRDFLGAGGMFLAAGSGETTASETTTADLVADLPMIRLRLPKGGFGREYVAIQLKIQGEGPFDFMVDTGLTTEFITPHLQKRLGIGEGRSRIRGLAGGGETNNPIIELEGASLCCGKISGGEELPLPSLRTIITDFPQEHIDPAHDPVEGMLGMEALSLFDVDFDFPNGRLRLWKPGTAIHAQKGMVEIPAVVINETGLIGIRLAGVGSTKQPILAFLDCGSPFSTANWAAAPYLGLPPKGDAIYQSGPTVMAQGIDGRPLKLSTTKKQLTYLGDTQTDSSGRPTGFETPSPSWRPWDAVDLAVGDLPAFQTVLGDGIAPYTGPAALLGLDILAQRRVILETGEGTRGRRVLVSPS